MAKVLSNFQKEKIVADYLETQSVNATAKMNNVAWSTVRTILDSRDIEKYLEQKKERDAIDIADYMEQKKQKVLSIIGKGLDVLDDKEKLREASPAQITTAIGTLIDKWTVNAPDQRQCEQDALDSLIDALTGAESD